MIRVLFVCLGNICRSPMAEAIFRHKIKERGLADQILVDSAGTGDWHIGKPPHEGTQKILGLHSISFEGMKARQVAGSDFGSFDYIVCMDDSNERNLRKLSGADQANILKFMDLLPDETHREVPDPYYTGNFDEVHRLINLGSGVLLDKIIEEKLK
ncbi:low molecular weight phosphotyrosine protein phosphatase [Neobacillus mesonae]|nr:low molecular weight phosphotyrosine protein phosphatase [Neobacillus mesonae]